MLIYVIVPNFVSFVYFHQRTPQTLTTFKLCGLGKDRKNTLVLWNQELLDNQRDLHLFISETSYSARDQWCWPSPNITTPRSHQERRDKSDLKDRGMTHALPSVLSTDGVWAFGEKHGIRWQDPQHTIRTRQNVNKVAFGYVQVAGPGILDERSRPSYLYASNRGI